MASLNSLASDINSVQPSNFDALALSIFNYQASHNSLFKSYLNYLGHSGKATELSELVFLPIELFKNHAIKTGDWQEDTVFESSGTTGSNTSSHYVKSLDVYRSWTVASFEELYGSLDDYTVLALLPSYIERGNSGLIAMVDQFIKNSGKPDSGYYLNEFEALITKLNTLRINKKKTILWGVTFALLDLAEQYQIDFPELVIMETGGMKGKRQELVRSEVHEILKGAFNVEQVHSEYGMTELSSQAYALEGGLFRPARSMKVLARDINDPFKIRDPEKTGALNIIDLQNIHTCSFIETKDLGKVYENGAFEVMGRMDNSDVRGCNLMVL